MNTNNINEIDYLINKCEEKLKSYNNDNLIIELKKLIKEKHEFEKNKKRNYIVKIWKNHKLILKINAIITFIIELIWAILIVHMIMTMTFNFLEILLKTIAIVLGNIIVITTLGESSLKLKKILSYINFNNKDKITQEDIDKQFEDLKNKINNVYNKITDNKNHQVKINNYIDNLQLQKQKLIEQQKNNDLQRINTTNFIQSPDKNSIKIYQKTKKSET